VAEIFPFSKRVVHLIDDVLRNGFVFRSEGGSLKSQQPGFACRPPQDAEEVPVRVVRAHAARTWLARVEHRVARGS